jgi:Mrp family chromosome partitioning ATPase
MSSKLVRAGAIDKELRKDTHLSVALPRGYVLKTAEFRASANWGETLLAAARLKHVLGSTRKLVAVSALNAKDGASELSARVALALAEIDKESVLIVDANSTASRMESLFDVPNSLGFEDVLEGRLDLKDAVCQLEPSNLWMLPLGGGAASLSALLTSPRCATVLRELRDRFRFILVDAGVVKSAEGTLLASLSDGVLIGLAAGERTKEELAGFQEELRRLEIPLLGVMLTKRSSGKA